MKKLLALLLVLAMAFSMMTFLTACGDDEDYDDDDKKSDSNDKDDDKNNDDKNTENSIVGTWQGEEADEIVTYTFKADGTFNADYTSGTYTISGNTITLIANIGGEEFKIFDNVAFSVDKNTLTMAGYTYTRQ